METVTDWKKFFHNLPTLKQLHFAKFRINRKHLIMRKSKQFWKDVYLAICILILREILHRIIIEGSKIYPKKL
jgi:hypothetical protein